MIHSDTLRLYLGIINEQKVIEEIKRKMENPTTEPEKIYTKKCECEKIPDDLF